MDFLTFKKSCSIQMQTLEFVYCTVICLTCEHTRLPSYLVPLCKLMFVHKCAIHFTDHYILCDFNYLFCFVCDSLSMTTGLQPLWRRFRLSFMMTLGIRKELLIWGPKSVLLSRYWNPESYNPETRSTWIYFA